MTQHSTLASPEVAAFVAAVRGHLADLDADVLDDLVGGLEADLADQVADGVPLGDPAAYAGELRAAAGLPDARPRRRRRARGALSAVQRAVAALRAPDALLDRGRDAVLTRTAHPRVRPAWEVLVALRPAWWFARAWIALTLLDAALGPAEEPTLVPSFGSSALSLAVLVVAVAGSVLIGLGRVWPGGTRDTLARVVLAGLNTVAVGTVVLGAVPVATDTQLASRFSYVDDYGYDQALREAQQAPLRNQGKEVSNIFAYDANGRPIPQVQLVDQDGRPLRLNLLDYLDTGVVLDEDGAEVPRGEYFCPAVNGTVVLRNVFPRTTLASDDPALGDEDPDSCRRRLVPLGVAPTFPVPGLSALVPPAAAAAPASPAPSAGVDPIAPSLP